MYLFSHGLPFFFFFPYSFISVSAIKRTCQVLLTLELDTEVVNYLHSKNTMNVFVQPWKEALAKGSMTHRDNQEALITAQLVLHLLKVSWGVAILGFSPFIYLFSFFIGWAEEGGSTRKSWGGEGKGGEGKGEGEGGRGR